MQPNPQHESAGFLASWKQLGIRSGAGFSRAMLYVLYWTLLVPFGLIARLGGGRPAFRDEIPAPNLHSQY